MSEHDVSRIGTAGASALGYALPVPGLRPGARDAFALAAGPDVRTDGPTGPVAVYAVFSVDAETNEVHVAVIDELGRLVRMIPAKSVSDMIRMMASYARV
jgi:hypothetical protein